ncbi:MAG: hypothetical protein CMK00_01045 [Planctomycetes bacterium]|nr:hypothetical protein [Planctomycetota bacterium]HJO27463.1 hypothetical protein [Planctomycetota bacterium]
MKILPFSPSMKHSTALIACVLLAAAAGAALRQGTRQGAPPPLPTAPESIDSVLYARRFTLDQPYRHNWRAERPTVTSGLLVVLSAAPHLLVPRQGLEPVLMFGDQTVERVNRGDGSGHLVAIVPDTEGAPIGVPDLYNRRAFFAAPALPEEVDESWIASQVARAAGLPPLWTSARQAVANADAPIHLDDRLALDHLAAELIMRYAPDESEHAAGLSAPLLR